VLLTSCALGLGPACKRSSPSTANSASASARSLPAPKPELSATTDTVSHASEHLDAGPPVKTVESVDGAALRQRHIARLKQDRSPVTVLGGGSAVELGQKICESVVPQRDAHTPILIKPNLCGFDGFKNPEKSGGDDGVRGRITQPEFVRGVVRCLKERGHTRITIAEGCGNSLQHWQKTISTSGFEQMAREEGVPLVALDDDGVHDVEGGQPGKPLKIRGLEHSHVPTLLMPKLLAEVLDHGLFISVPKLKAHRFSVVSIGIKGMQGVVMRSDASPAYNQKWRMHDELRPYLRAKKQKQPEDRAEYVRALELFSERMLDVLEVALPDVVLVDGAPAMSGDGFQNLRPMPGQLALGGTNPVLVDRVGAEYLGLWNNRALARELGGHQSSPLIERAAQRYGVDLRAPAITGDGQALLTARRPLYFKAIAPFALEGEQVRTAPAESVATASAEARPTAHALRSSTSPKIDAVVDELWQRAPAVRFDTDYAGEPTGIFTTARFVWNETGLFGLFELEQNEVNVDLSRPLQQEREKLYQEDCVELFFTPDATNTDHYYEIELGPLGHFFDLEIDRQHKLSRTEWSSGVVLATQRDAANKTSWLEAHFPAPEILAALRPNARLPFALYRMEGKPPRRYLAWSPPRTTKPNFHVPGAFGTLVLEP